MGYSRWSSSDWDQHKSTVENKTREQIFKQRSIHKDLDPKNITMRESVDSEKNPNSNPIIISCDVTGSMGILAEIIVREGLNTVIQNIYDRKPVSDPHICIMATGDARTDFAPLQVTQFEADISLVDQLKNIWIEGHGGGNGGETYGLAYWFAAFKCITDCYQKRGKKGYLFTIGDESPHPELNCSQITKYLGVGCESDMTTKELVEEAQKYWNIYHLMVKPVPNQNVEEKWHDLLGRNALLVEDYRKIPETIVSIIQIAEGANSDDVVNSWDESTKTVIKSAADQLLLAAN